MASASSSSGNHDMEQSFSLAAGSFTEAEKEYLRKNGLIYENSNDETLDISTDVENTSGLNRSHGDSLLLFEENERLYKLLNKSIHSQESPMQVSPAPTLNSPEPRKSANVNSPEVRRSGRKSSLHHRSCIGCTGHGSPISLPGSPTGGAESDKENEFKGPMTVQRRILFKDENEVEEEKKNVSGGGRDPLEEIKGVAEESMVVDFCDSDDKSQEDDRDSQLLSEEEENVCIVPCTQEVSVHEMSIQITEEIEEEVVVPCTQAPDEEIMEDEEGTEAGEIVPCTQEEEAELVSEEGSSEGPDVIPATQVTEVRRLSVSLNVTYSSETLEESLRDASEDSIDVVPCSQFPDNLSAINDTGLSSCSMPCSQGSTTEGSSTSQSRSELDDTISQMERLLKLADEQEEREKAEAAAKLQQEEQSAVEPEPPQLSEESQEEAEIAPATEGVVVFKTPLKHNRVQLLKNKKVASPSPPRTLADKLLQQRTGPGAGTFKSKPAPAVDRKITIPQRKSESAGPSTPLRTSTPKRAPLTNITPASKKTHTPGRTGLLKTPVSAKVDSGLRSPYPLLSPVARYIYDKPAPSKFARVQGIPNPKATQAQQAPPAAGANLSRIPLPPPRTSNVPMAKPKTPASASKRGSHSVLRTSTYFNLTSTPPQIVGNEKSMLEKKQRFQQLQYTGPQKVKEMNGNVASPRKDDYVAHRHTGLRDESGNASFIQNTIITKRNVPTMSRLTTPKSYTKH